MDRHRPFVGSICRWHPQANHPSGFPVARGAQGEPQADDEGNQQYFARYLGSLRGRDCNVMSPEPFESSLHGEALSLAKEIHDHLTPRTTAYAEIWLDGEKTAVGEEKIEPIYGKTYLPRKFKIAVAVPPRNDADASPTTWLRGDCREWPDCRIQRVGRRRSRNDAWQNDYFPQGSRRHRVLSPRIKRYGWPRRSSRFSGISGIDRTGATPV